MRDDSDESYSVVFHISDQAKFEPFRQRLCDLMKVRVEEGKLVPDVTTNTPLVEGAVVRAIGWGNRCKDLREAERYIDYLIDFIESGTPSYELQEIEEWLEKRDKV